MTQVALGGALVDLDDLAVAGLAEHDHAVGVVGVVVVEAVRASTRRRSSSPTMRLISPSCHAAVQRSR